MRVRAVITTCDRPAMLARLIGQLRSQAARQGVRRLDLCLYDDASLEPAWAPQLHLLRRYDDRQGRRGYWRIWRDVLTDALHDPYDYLVTLPDDVTLRRGFFSQAVRTWEAIDDGRKICLNLLRDTRAFSASWTRYRPHLVRMNGLSVIRSQWMDLCVFSTAALFAALDHRIDPIRPSGLVSSGVGRQFSIRLADQGFSLYCVYETLVEHGGHASQMHPTLERPTT